MAAVIYGVGWFVWVKLIKPAKLKRKERKSRERIDTAIERHYSVSGKVNEELARQGSILPPYSEHDRVIHAIVNHSKVHDEYVFLVLWEGQMQSEWISFKALHEDPVYDIKLQEYLREQQLFITDC